MTAIEQIRQVVKVLEARHAIDVELFGETGGETLESKEALFHAKAVQDWFEGLIPRVPNLDFSKKKPSVTTFEVHL